MKKIGILTYYYNSINYGGVLQAYALVKQLEMCGLDAKQISFDYTKQKSNKNKQLNIKKYFRKKIKQVIYYWLDRKLYKRYVYFINFRESIPHTETIYTNDNIVDSNALFDIFVVGSDQVWNPLWYNPSFFLNFVDKTKTKIAYAVSIGTKKIDEIYEDKIKKELKSFYAVSIREQESSLFVGNIIDKEVEWVLDPTLLLTKKDWDSILSDVHNNLPSKPYVLCYFLGNDIRDRILARKFAKERKLSLAVISHPAGFNSNDLWFGENKLFDTGPKEFINLIKNADYVFTDSFHASVFSLIYNKQFFVFPRLGKEDMGNRIYSLLALFNCMDYFLDTKEKKTIEYINSLSSITYEDLSKFETLKKKSLSFILKYIKKSSSDKELI